MLRDLRSRARALKRETLTVYCAARDPRTPWLARGLAVLVVMYALSPVDLIPDFIPVLGLLDDVILVPLGVWLVLKWIPAHVLEASKQQAATLEKEPVSYAGLAFMALIWIAAAVWLGRVLWNALG
jgi:uncharacterized membrane protein YkvA (DUF1232 family)